MNQYQVRHCTKYRYELPVLHAHHLAHLRPRQLAHQDAGPSHLEIVPRPSCRHSAQDYFGNACDEIEVLSAHEHFEVIVTTKVKLTEPPVLRLVQQSGVRLPGWEASAAEVASDPKLLSAREFVFDSPLVRSHEMLRAYAEPSFPRGGSLLDGLRDLNERINNDFSYEPMVTDVSTPLARVMRERRGVCQDFAHVMIGCLRSLGLPARYVSGYLETSPPPDRPRLVGSDASHAWVAAFLPRFGWLDFDPTNAMLPSECHVTVAYGRDFSDVSPLKGVVLGGGRHRVEVGVDVLRA